MGAFRTVYLVVVLAVGCGGRAPGSGVSAGGSTAGVSGGASGVGAPSGSTGCGDNAYGCPLPQCASSPACGGSAGVPIGATLVYPGDGCGVIVICPTGQSCQGGYCAPTFDASSDRMTGVTDVDGSCNLCGDAGGSAQATPPSCAPGGPGMTDCGPGGSGKEGCCTSLEVTGGTYYRTYTNNGTGPTGEADPASVSSF